MPAVEPRLEHEHVPQLVTQIAALREVQTPGFAHGDGSSTSWRASAGAARRSSAQGRSGPRNQSLMGTPKPILGRSTRARGTCRYSTWRSTHFETPSRQLRGRRQPPGDVEHASVEERRPGLEGDGHRARSTFVKMSSGR